MPNAQYYDELAKKLASLKSTEPQPIPETPAQSSIGIKQSSSSPIEAELPLTKDFTPEKQHGFPVGLDFGKIGALPPAPIPQQEDPLLQQLQNIQESRRQGLQNLALAETGAKIGEAITRRHGGEIPSSEKFFQQLKQQTELPLQEFTEKQQLLKEKKKEAREEIKSKIEDLDLENTEKMSSPNSTESKYIQQMIIRLNPKMEKSEELLNAPANLLMKTFPILEQQLSIDARNKAMAEASEDRKLRRDELNAQFKERMQQRDEDQKRKIGADYRQVADKMDNNPILKKIKEQELSLDQVDQLIKEVNKGNSVAFNALGAKMAKAMGEVGALTEGDVKRYVRTGQLTQKAGDILDGWLNGRPTKSTMQDINSIANVLKQSFTSKTQPIYDTYAQRLSRTAIVPIEEAYYLLDVPMPEKAEQSGEFYKKSIAPVTKIPQSMAPSPSIAPGKKPEQLSLKHQQAIDWAKKNPDDPNAQLILKRHGL